MSTESPLLAEKEPAPISRPPTTMEKLQDRAFRGLCLSFAWLTILLVVAIVWEVGRNAWPAMQSQGLGFLTSAEWNASKGQFGILNEIGGTMYSSVLGVGIGSIFGLTVAIFLTQDFLPHSWTFALKNIIELLAAIPSVVYGLWGIFVLIPLVRPPANWLHDHLGWIPIFGTRLSGPGMLPAGPWVRRWPWPCSSAIPAKFPGRCSPRPTPWLPCWRTSSRKRRPSKSRP